MICSGVVVMFDAWSPLAARRGEGSWHPGLAWRGWVQALAGASPGYVCQSVSARIQDTISPLTIISQPVKVITTALIIFIGALKIYELL